MHTRMSPTCDFRSVREGGAGLRLGGGRRDANVEDANEFVL
jgi:hypothetical protein